MNETNAALLRRDILPVLHQTSVQDSAVMKEASLQTIEATARRHNTEMLPYESNRWPRDDKGTVLGQHKHYNRVRNCCETESN